MTHRRPYIKNRRHALVLGMLATGAGSFLLWDGFEHRGKPRPSVAALWSHLL